jgi:aminoglycoside 3-N-acetyltransferase
VSPFSESIKQLISQNSSSYVLVHTDIFRARASIVNTSNPQVMLERHLEALELMCGDKSIFFPVFNYDYAKTRVYRPDTDASQIGILNEFARKNWAKWRCGPPIFNFCGNASTKPTISESGQCDPFGSDTAFGFLHREKSHVLMYGAPFSSFTAIHYIERLSGGPLYRYDKVFSGTVVHGDGETTSVDLNYHCRPMGRSLEYDWQRLRADLEREGILRVLKVPGSEVLLIDIASMCSHWLSKLEVDPLFLIDTASRTWVELELARLGRRFLITDFEGES